MWGCVLRAWPYKIVVQWVSNEQHYGQPMDDGDSNQDYDSGARGGKS